MTEEADEVGIGDSADDRSAIRELISPEDLSPEQRRERRVDIVSALLLAIATVLAAWSAFQSAKWSGLQAISFANANASRQEYIVASGTARSQIQIDVETFIQFVDARRVGDVMLAKFYRERMRDEFLPALDAWLKTHPLVNPGAPETPFAMPEYQLEALKEADELSKRAEAFGKQALADNQRSDNYVLLAVLFAAVLLFAGLAPKSRTFGVQVAMLGLAVVLLLVGIGFLMAFPKAL
jgi:hypothetical protein